MYNVHDDKGNDAKFDDGHLPAQETLPPPQDIMMMMM